MDIEFIRRLLADMENESKKRAPPSPREYRKKRRRKQKVWGLTVPDKINNIKDLITFSHTYRGSHVDVSKLMAIEDSLLELDNMIGIDPTKRSILDMIMHFSQGRHRKNEDYLHIIVCGPPGCGKTTFCRILGKILSGLGVLPKNTFTIVKRTDFIAKYLGQTAHRTEALLKKCLGGVMFLDEAYSLAPRGNDRDSFSKEAIDFLNQFLSEHKDDLCCIIAGYEEELQQTIFAMNNGMERRFPWKFTIEAYTNEELLLIFKKMIKDADYKLEDGAIDSSFFATNKEFFKFAGGDIETFITKCKFIHTRNTFGKEPDNLFRKTDIVAALEEHKKHKKKQTDNRPPDHLYL